MKPLVTCQRVLSWVFIIPSDEPMGERKKRIHISAILFSISCLIVFCVASVIFFIKNVSADLESALYALSQIVAIAPCFNIVVAVFILRHKIAEIFKRLAEIHNECKYIRLLLLDAFHVLTHFFESQFF